MLQRISLAHAGILVGFYAQKAIRTQQRLQLEITKHGKRLQKIIHCTYDVYVSMDESGNS